MSPSGRKIDNRVFRRFPLLETGRLRLRPLHRQDAFDLLALRTDPDVMRYMDVKPFRSVQEARQWIATYRQRFRKKKSLVWALATKSDDRFIGYAGFWRMMPEQLRAEIAYAILPSDWGKGLMSEAMQAMLDFGFQQLRVHSIEANINPENLRSRKLLEKFGFSQEAHFRENYFFEGQFIDTVVFSILEQDWKEKLIS